MFVVGGESLIDLVPKGPGPAAERQPIAGGSPFNCAIALAKLGGKTGFLCPISSDEFGDMLLAPLQNAGVAVLMEERVASPTTKAIVTFNDRMQASYEFVRGAERDFSPATLLAALPPAVDVLQLGGFVPIETADAQAWQAVADKALSGGATLTMDINVRPLLIDDAQTYRTQLNQFLDAAHLIKLSDEDHAWLEPGLSIEAHARALLDRPNCKLVVMTLGEHGSVAFTKTVSAKAEIYAPPVFVDTVGAGDTLMAGVLTALNDHNVLAPDRLGALDAATLQSVLRFGAVAAGLNCGKKGCQPPTRSEVEAALSA